MKTLAKFLAAIVRKAPAAAIIEYLPFSNLKIFFMFEILLINS